MAAGAGTAAHLTRMPASLWPPDNRDRSAALELNPQQPRDSSASTTPRRPPGLGAPWRPAMPCSAASTCWEDQLAARGDPGFAGVPPAGGGLTRPDSSPELSWLDPLQQVPGLVESITGKQCTGAIGFSARSCTRHRAPWAPPFEPVALAGQAE